MRVSARPVYFSRPGHDGSPLFALYNAPVGVPTGLGVVICPPIGSELMRSYRALRELAAVLAGRGIAVLHLDYHGTGNSAGRDEDPDRIAAWTQSIDAAVDELRRLGGVARVGLFGVRLGAALAALAASARDDIDRLVLWGACRSGKALARELRMLRMTEEGRTSDAPADEGDQEAGGFIFTRATMEALAKVDLTKLPRPPARRVLVVHRDDMPADQQLVKALVAGGADVTVEQWAGYAAMNQHPHESVAPMELFAHVAAWLAPERAGAGDAATNAASVDVAEAASDVPAAATAVRETAFRFGGDVGLFAVLSQPTNGVARRRTAVLFTSTGANYHVGPNRLYTKLARDWAADGFDVMRMDLSGIGQSELRPGGTPNQPYPDARIEDLRLGLDELRRRTGAERTVVIGLCSGSHIAFHASLAGVRFDGQILINPALYYVPGDPLDEGLGQRFDEMQRYKGSALQLDKWKKLLTGKVAYRALAGIAARRAWDVVGPRLKHAGRNLGVYRPKKDVGRDLLQVVDGGADTHFVFADGDAGLDYLRREVRLDLERVLKMKNVKLSIIPGANHTFSDCTSQKKLGELLTTHLMRTYR